MTNENKRNLQYFESSSMRELYDRMQNWQNENQKRFLSISIQDDTGMFCCIALTNPTEVVITNEDGSEYVGISNGRLRTYDT